MGTVLCSRVWPEVLQSEYLKRCRMFCQATGYGGTVQQGATVEEKIRRRAESQVDANSLDQLSVGLSASWCPIWGFKVWEYAQTTLLQQMRQLTCQSSLKFKQGFGSMHGGGICNGGMEGLHKTSQ